MDKKETIEVPHFEGYECIGFVVPGDNLPCHFLTSTTRGLGFFLESADYDYDVPMICYRKIKPKRHVFEETGEYRPAKYGDYYMRGHLILHWGFTGESDHSYIILRRVEGENE